MKINTAKSAGFCFGVKRAIAIARKYAGKNKPVYMLGDIVHNETVVHSLSILGIKKIKRLGKGKGKILLIRAHGEAKEIYVQAKKKGYKIIDATCPMVKEIHKLADSLEKKGFRIIIIGDRKHAEVKGITGQIKQKAVIIDGLKNIPLKKLSRTKKTAVLVQSTQDYDETQAIVRQLKKHIPGLKFFNTICVPTREKQAETKKMPLENEAMIIIGSKTSANTKRLYQLSKKINKNTHWIQSANDIKKEWFSKTKKTGITAGASTPDETIKEVTCRIKRIVTDNRRQKTEARKQKSDDRRRTTENGRQKTENEKQTTKNR